MLKNPTIAGKKSLILPCFSLISRENPIIAISFPFIAGKKSAIGCLIPFITGNNPTIKNIFPLQKQTIYL